MMDEGSRSPLEDALLDTVEYALINLVRHYPELYNPQDPGNRDKGRRDAAWADISRQLNKDGISALHINLSININIF